MKRRKIIVACVLIALFKTTIANIMKWNKIIAIITVFRYNDSEKKVITMLKDYLSKRNISVYELSKKVE